MEKKVIQFKISLNFSEPEIWRRFIVYDSISLHKFHEIIQIVMGWENYHLYSFKIKKVDYQPPDPDGDDDFGFFGLGPPPKNSLKIKLSDLNLRSRSKFLYTYDFGDNWDHTITLEKILENDKGIKVPSCLEGDRNCPPEDCGSIFGYENILKVLKKKKKNEDDLELMEWLGEDYNPEYFNIEMVNTLLKPPKPKKTELKLIQGGGKNKK
jgi:hypothetical protein